MDVTVNLQGTLAARTGTHSATLGVPAGATVRDVVDALADQYGTPVRRGVLDGDRLRSDTLAYRSSGDDSLSATSPVEPGDTLQFRHSG